MSKREAIEHLLSKRQSTEIQNPVNTGIQESVNKKKATFDFDGAFHTELKIFAAGQDRKMVDIVVDAVKEYMDKHKP